MGLEDGEVDGDNALHAHLLPKLMLPFKDRPGEMPRKVQLQRCVGVAVSKD